MSTEAIEQKISEIERRLAAVEATAGKAPTDAKPKGAWRDLIGWEKDDELFRDAVKLGAEWRAKANAEGR